MKKGSVQLVGKRGKLQQEFVQELLKKREDQKNKRLDLAQKYLQTRFGYSEHRAKLALHRS